MAGLGKRIPPGEMEVDTTFAVYRHVDTNNADKKLPSDSTGRPLLFPSNTTVLVTIVLEILHHDRAMVVLKNGCMTNIYGTGSRIRNGTRHKAVPTCQAGYGSLKLWFNLSTNCDCATTPEKGVSRAITIGIYVHVSYTSAAFLPMPIAFAETQSW